MNFKGWSDIGYHYGIEDINGQIKIRLGRDTNKVGAHTKGMNTHSIGICVVGNFDMLRPAPKKIRKLVNLVRMLQDTYCVSIGHVIGHREAQVYLHGNATKSCPGNMFSMEELRGRIGDE